MKRYGTILHFHQRILSGEVIKLFFLISAVNGGLSYGWDNLIIG